MRDAPGVPNGAILHLAWGRVPTWEMDGLYGRDVVEALVDQKFARMAESRCSLSPTPKCRNRARDLVELQANFDSIQEG